MATPMILTDDDIAKSETSQVGNAPILTDEDIAKSEPIETSDTGSSAKGLLTAFGLGGAGVYGAKKAIEATAPARTNIAGNLMNSIIKPRHKEYMFGKNPGKGMAQEGISGMNIESLGNKVEQRLNQLSEYSKQIRSLSENKIKTVNLESMFEPLKELSTQFSKAKLTNKAHLDKISNIVKDLRSNIPKELSIKEMPLETAYGLKKVVENLQKWDVQTSADDMMNKALKKMYHNVDASIDITVPELKSVNSRMANLISAKSAIRNRMETLSKQDPTAIGNILSMPIKGTIGSTAVKSGLAKILSEKFGMVGKKIPGLLSVGNTVFDAMKYSEDPEGYLYQLERGSELPPKGSMEREIELGRMI